VEPIKFLKKFTSFSPKKEIHVIQDTRPIYRYILDLGQKGSYIVNSEIPNIRIINNHFLDVNNLYRRGGGSVEPIRVVFREILGDSDIRQVLEWPTIRNNKINATLQRIDPTGTVVNQWLLYGCFPTEIMYENFEPLELTLHMDHFTLQF
jgi:hypothetical protein